MGGGGVDGAVHDEAGPELVKASRALAPCPAGQAKLTSGFELTARFVIHAVGPVYDGGDYGEAEILEKAYRSSLEIATEKEFQTIAFPCISTGAYGFPQTAACHIAIATVFKWQQDNPKPETVIFCCYDDWDARLYRE